MRHKGLSTSERNSLRRIVNINRRLTRNNINRRFFRNRMARNSQTRKQTMKRLIREGYNNIMGRSLLEHIKERNKESRAKILREEAKKRRYAEANKRAKKERNALIMEEALAGSNSEANNETMARFFAEEGITEEKMGK